MAALTDPRKTTEAEAQKIIHTEKPIYWITSGIHSPETGGAGDAGGAGVPADCTGE